MNFIKNLISKKITTLMVALSLFITVSAHAIGPLVFIGLLALGSLFPTIIDQVGQQLVPTECSDIQKVNFNQTRRELSAMQLEVTGEHENLAGRFDNGALVVRGDMQKFQEERKRLETQYADACWAKHGGECKRLMDVLAKDQSDYEFNLRAAKNALNQAMQLLNTLENTVAENSCTLNSTRIEHAAANFNMALGTAKSFLNSAKFFSNRMKKSNEEAGGACGKFEESVKADPTAPTCVAPPVASPVPPKPVTPAPGTTRPGSIAPNQIQPGQIQKNNKQ